MANYSNNPTINNLLHANPLLRFTDGILHWMDDLKLSKRYTLAILTFIGFNISFAIRSNYCINYSDNDIEAKYADKMNGWFVLTFFVVQIPSGVISYKYSATRLYGLCILGAAIVSFLTPIVVSWYPPIIEIGAFLQGIFQGAANPAFYSIWRYWAPPLERSTLVTLGYAGTFSGVVIGYQLSVTFCSMFTWDKILYVYGVLGVLWYLIWWWLVVEHPSEHPSIIDQEYVYLQQTIDVKPETLPIPWRKIFTSMPVWALFVSGFCRSWFLIHLHHATYSQVNEPQPLGLGVHIELHNFLMAISLSLAGYAADRVLKETTISTTNLRKIFICGGLLLSAAVFIPTVFDVLFTPKYINMIMYFVAIVYSISLAGYYANHLDVAARYAGITMAISNDISTMGAFLPHQIEFHIFTLLMSVIIVFTFGAIFYAVYGSAEQQSWAMPVQNGVKYHYFDCYS
ncbi:probable vesicular glutamate transporter eat-4 isoform X2 [Chrysoperla carnea]|uniref:probable vesicular glutamate transporter eat-4 isoform X2 n=1 Tax=Chrysoperla carnea TaxID=189513 RepID=UPI001D067AAF|nr:probable vesicular glutamate transporter eat-4 isoform X2 [Chrysoperla carnea]